MWPFSRKQNKISKINEQVSGIKVLIIVYEHGPDEQLEKEVVATYKGQLATSCEVITYYSGGIPDASEMGASYGALFSSPFLQPSNVKSGYAKAAGLYMRASKEHGFNYPAERVVFNVGSVGGQRVLILMAAG